MLNYTLKPTYAYQVAAWKNHKWDKDSSPKTNKPRKTFKEIAEAVMFSSRLMGKALGKRVKCTILYASETGKSERFAKNLHDIFKHNFHPKLISMDKYDFVQLNHETLLFVVTSTFGNGYFKTK
jgi:sulfite reductase alpha subunit-like flavoprotein